MTIDKVINSLSINVNFKGNQTIDYSSRDYFNPDATKANEY